jgi:cephalosporin hydroxylase
MGLMNTRLQSVVGRWRTAPDPSRITAQFHQLYYDSQVWRNTYWFGIETQKCPLDMWVYQEIVHELRPDVIIETGTWNGGSALYLASIFDLLGSGRVITVDIEVKEGRPEHPRITYLSGRSSTAPEVLSEVRSLVGAQDSVMVILDSDHGERHVLDELGLYSPLVSPGQYLIVEDTNINGHPVLPGFGPGPMEAVDKFIAEAIDFTIDASKEKLFMTFNPRGYLKRKGSMSQPGG